MLPLWEISYFMPSHGGYSIAHVTAATRAEAITKGRKQVTKWYPNPKPQANPNVVHKYGKAEEQELILDRIYQYFPHIYDEIYDSGTTKGVDLIKEAKRKIGKDKWGRVWFR